jgi:hypothetical protein
MNAGERIWHDAMAAAIAERKLTVEECAALWIFLKNPPFRISRQNGRRIKREELPE